MPQILINSPKLSEIIGSEVYKIMKTRESSSVCLARYSDLQVTLHVTGDPDQFNKIPIEGNIIVITE